MPQTTYTFKKGATEYAYTPVFGGYSGFTYDDELAVQKLLGKDPARADKNEVIQSTGLGAKVATLDVYATTAQRDSYVTNLLWASAVTLSDGIDAAKAVVVTKLDVVLYHKVTTRAPVWKITFHLREV